MCMCVSGCSPLQWRETIQIYEGVRERQGGRGGGMSPMDVSSPSPCSDQKSETA